MHMKKLGMWIWVWAMLIEANLPYLLIQDKPGRPTWLIT